MSDGKQHTFASLIEDVQFIEIPIIQRDYAQGSQAVEDVRDAFLDNLHSAIVGASPPLDLDFIYGSIHGENARTLSLLDGQQRLTTLFLLHWYLAVRDGQLLDFRQRWVDPQENRSRFSYATRPSAREFFDALATRPCALPAAGALSDALMDQMWFFDAWQRDPTVRCACEMLNAIHRDFHGDTGLYDTLVHKRRITFHFLELRRFGLSDELYIKMNARGKALTPFENLKAWLVERVASMPWAQEFDLKLDQAWTDFFWTASRSSMAKGSTFDELFVRFFHVAAFLQTCEDVSSRFHALLPEARKWIEKLRDVPAQLSLRELETHNALSSNTLQDVMRSLDYFTGPEGADHVVPLLRVLRQRPEYEDLLHVHALMVFHRQRARTAEAASDMPVHLDRWLRVTRNLVRNSRIEEPGAAVQAIRGLTTLSAHAFDLYEQLARGVPDLTGFSRDQVAEESRKAALIIADSTWKALLLEAEGHWYLQGRVAFLLDLAVKPAAAAGQQPEFRKYLLAFKKCFAREILESKDFVLQRALFSLYDFLPAAGSNHTFCSSNATAYRDRLENWLPVIQDARFQQLLDQVVLHGDESLHLLIDKSAVADWRAYLIKNPELMRYCRARMVRRVGLDLLLLSKMRLTGFHAELRSRALYETIRRKLKQGQLPGVEKVDYQEALDDNWPELTVRAAGLSYRMSWQQGRWHCFDDARTAVAVPQVVAECVGMYFA